MSEDKKIILLKAAKELNISIATIVEHLAKKGISVDNKPSTKIEGSVYDILLKDFQGDKIHKEEAKSVTIGKLRKEETAEVIEAKPVSKTITEEEEDEILIKNIPAVKPAAKEETKTVTKTKEKQEEAASPSVKVIGKIDLESLNTKTRLGKKAKAEKVEEVEEVKVPEVKVKEKEKEEEENQPVVKKTTKKKTEEVKEEKIEEPVPVVAKKVEEVIEEEKVVEKIEPPVIATEEKVIAAPVVEEEKDETIRAKANKLSGPNIVGKIDLAEFAPKKKTPTPVASSSSAPNDVNKKKRKRKEAPKNEGQQQPRTDNRPGGGPPGQGNNQPRPPFNKPGGFNKDNRRGDFKPRDPVVKEEPTEKEIQDQIKATLARLSGAGKSGKFSSGAKFRRQKRDKFAASAEEAALEQELQSKILKVTEFVTANELAKMMDVSVTQVISTCMSLGLFVSINQRLDAETLAIVADEFGYEIQFVTADAQEENLDEEDRPEDLLPRAPIVTVMGHVDHGKTSLLDFVRKANVIAGEAGGITQHIGAYEVTLENGKKITFLDTPGHEAFTAMRARGAKVTDIVIIVIAADDSVMPQTKEAINHAQAAGVPIIFAYNKMDRPGANPDKIREQLSQMNILVEEWGGKYQSQEISAKSGMNVELLLEKVLLEAELLDLKANPNKRAVGTVIESALDKGRGIVTTVLIQAGTMKIGDPILAGCYSGRVKALFNERGQKVDSVGPAQPVQVLGMTGAPQAGDKFNSMESEVEAREIANKRLQLQREQGIRTQKHITLDEIGRRLAIGNFKELNVIVKGDVDGSIEALSDSLLKLSTEEIQVNIIHKSVGQISESDVLLASASDAIIIGFQVRPSQNARKLAEQEQIDIRLYSIIYDAINEIKSAMEGMLSPEIEEKIIANVEIRETFKITKVGTIAGCMVLDGKISRNSKIRIVRDGVVVYTGELASLKRFKDDVKEVAAGYECGLNIQNFNDIKVGDIVEAYEQVEVKRKL
jgi:translation initiation factor IF-2